MGQFLFNGNAQLNQSLIAEVLEEHHSVPNMAIHFFEYVTFKRLRERVNELFFLTEIKIAFDFSALLDVLHDTSFSLVADELRFFLNLIEGFKMSSFCGFI